MADADGARVDVPATAPGSGMSDGAAASTHRDKPDTWMSSLQFAVPGACYFVSNNIFYLVLEYFDPAGRFVAAVPSH